MPSHALSSRVEHDLSENAKFWLRFLTEVTNRGVRGVCMLVCDGCGGMSGR